MQKYVLENGTVFNFLRRDMGDFILCNKVYFAVREKGRERNRRRAMLNQ